MKTLLSSTTLSLVMAAAAVGGCSGGSSGQTQDNNANAFLGGLPPDVRNNDKQAVVDSTVDYSLALRSAALKLKGTLPTLAEMKQVRDAGANQQMVYEQLVDQYIASPAFAVQQLEFWRNNFKMGGTLPVGGGVNMEFAPAFAAQLVVEEKPFNKLVTETAGTCPTFNAGTGTFTAGACPNAQSVGVLTDAGMQAQFFSSMAFRRVRWVQETLMCSRFPAEITGTPVPMGAGSYSSPWPFESITGKANNAMARIDFLDTSTQNNCASCHTTMNHIAPLFGNYNASGMLQATIQVQTPIPGSPTTVPGDWLPTTEKTAWRYMKPANNMAELGSAIAADPDFAKCMATRVWNWAMSRGDVVLDGTFITNDLATQLTGSLSSNNWNMKKLIRQTFTSASFVRY